MSFEEFKSLRSARIHAPQGHELAGDLAENEIEKHLRSVSSRNSFIFKGKRVPRRGSKGRYEIDIILLTQRHLYILEVKNYSGSIAKAGDRWIQTRRNGEQLFHKDILALNQKKLESLSHYIGNTELPENFVQQRVLFYKNILLSPEILGDHRVVTHDQIQTFLPKMSVKSRMEEHFFSALINFLVSEEEQQSARESVLHHKITKETCQRVAHKLDKLRTWDEIGLHGGRVLKGDAYTLYVENKEYPLKEYPPEVGFSCKWTRNRLFGFIKSLKGKALGTIKSKHRVLNLTPSKDKIKIHIVGNENPSYVYLREVEWFCKG